MRFFTENEVETFDFSEAHIGELRFGPGFFYMLLDNVKILENNSKNRDVRTMRTNGLMFRIMNPQVVAVTEEGCKIYNADGVLQQEVPDRPVRPEEYVKLCKKMEDAVVFELKKEDSCYRISADTEDHAYILEVQGSGDSEEWERFMNMTEM